MAIGATDFIFGSVKSDGQLCFPRISTDRSNVSNTTGGTCFTHHSHVQHEISFT